MNTTSRRGSRRALGIALTLVGATALGQADEPAAPPDPGVLAQHLLRGSDEEAARALTQARGLGEPAARTLLEELAQQARLYRRTDTTSVKGLVLEKASLVQAAERLAKVTGIPVTVSPRAVAEHESVSITLHLDGASLTDTMNVLTEPFGLRWGARGSKVTILSPQELPGADASPTPSGIAQRLKSTTMTMSVKDISVVEFVELLRQETKIELVIDPRILPEVKDVRVSVDAKDQPLDALLTMLAPRIGPGVTWTLKGEVVLITLDSLVPK
jgi:type II secretory pathway component GspD/PulD (secretin)